MDSNKKIKRKLSKIISVLLDLFIFIALAYTIFVNFADAMIFNQEKKAVIILFSLIVSLLIPGMILILLHALEKSEDKNEDLETKINYLKYENSILLKKIKDQY